MKDTSPGPERLREDSWQCLELGGEGTWVPVKSKRDECNGANCVPKYNCAARVPLKRRIWCVGRCTDPSHAAALGAVGQPGLEKKEGKRNAAKGDLPYLEQ